MEIKDYVLLRKNELKKEVDSLFVKPHLVIIQVNEDPASDSYIKGKLKDSSEVGVVTTLLKMPVNTTQDELLKKIEEINIDNSIHGLIVQMPLPHQIDEEVVKLHVSPKKDVDGFHPLSKLDPCTPKGILNYLKVKKSNLLEKMLL
jgi:methylenetetrahydrofolate dehydrogenase (NADP+) / methenyltetrahydrofolate cyclohydrolase